MDTNKDFTVYALYAHKARGGGKQTCPTAHITVPTSTVVKLIEEVDTAFLMTTTCLLCHELQACCLPDI